MGITPLHPNCELKRPLRPKEMVEMIQYEGLVGLGRKLDVLTARGLALRGLVAITGDPSDPERAMPHIVDTHKEHVGFFARIKNAIG